MDQNSDSESIEPKIEYDLSKLCFICLNGNSTDHSHKDDKLAYLRRNASESDKEKDNKYFTSSVKILTGYILQNSLSSSNQEDRNKLQISSLSSISNGTWSLCSECLSKAENLLELRLELEKIQMQILEVLRNLQDYLRSSFGDHHEKKIEDDEILSRFQDVVINEFMRRELSDGTQVRLERLSTAGFGISSLIFHPNSDKLSSVNPENGNEALVAGGMTSKNDDNDDDLPEEYKCYVRLERLNHADYGRRASTPNRIDDAVAGDAGTDPLIPGDDEDYHPDADEIEEGSTSLVPEKGSRPPLRKRGQKGPLTWDCEICLESIPYEEMKPHLETHPEFEKYYECELCPPSNIITKRIYGTYKGLIWHYIKRRHKVKVPCRLCPDQSILFMKVDLCKHLYEFHHINHKRLPCRDEGCSEEFYDSDTQHTHFFVKHSPSVECPVCSEPMMKCKLAHHLQTNHDMKLAKPKKSEDEKLKDRTCPICEKVFKLKSRRDLHVQGVHAEKLFKCDSCPKEFKSEAYLKIHVETAHEQGRNSSVACPRCHKEFKHKSLLRRHVKLYHERKGKPRKSEEPNILDKHPPNTSNSLDVTEDNEDCAEIFVDSDNEDVGSDSDSDPPSSYQEGEGETQDIEDSMKQEVNTMNRTKTKKQGGHSKAQKNKNSLTCQYCNKTLKSKYFLIVHEKTHTGKSDQVECSECQRKFSHKYLLRKHINGVHKRKTEETVLLQCKACPKTFLSEASLMSHEEGHNQNQIPVKTEENPGSQSYLNDYDRNSVSGENPEHMDVSRDVKVIATTSENGSRPPARKRGQTGPMTWDCEICLESIPYEDMKSHLEAHPEFEKYYECELCPPTDRADKRIYGTYKGLIWHYLKRRHKIPQVPCKLCPDQSILFGKTEVCKHLYEFHQINHKKLPCKDENCSEEFYDANTRHNHFLLRHLDPSAEGVECPMCSESMKKRKLPYHLQTNHGIKLAKPKKSEEEKLKDKTCPICEKIFTLKSRRDLHVQKVHREKQFKCDLCPKEFKSESYLRVHVKIAHEQGKNSSVECPRCRKEFKHKSLMNQHIKLYHEKKGKPKRSEVLLHCQFCPKSFRWRSCLVEHEEAHRNPRKHKCSQCSYSVNTKSALRTHIKGHKEKAQKCKSNVDVENTSSSFDMDGNEDMKSNDLKVNLHHRSNRPPHRKRGQTGPMTWDCEICLESIPYQEMTTHLKAHPEFEKLYECEDCPLSDRITKRIYGTFKGLIWHSMKRRHLGKVPCKLCPEQDQSRLFNKTELCKHLYEFHQLNHKKLPCKDPNCSEEFYDYYTLMRHHAEIHLGRSRSQENETVGCPHCSKTIKKINLEHHIKLWHEKSSLESTCHVCEKVFKLRSLRDQHVRTVHPEEFFGCKSCSSTFKDKLSLELHETTHRKVNGFMRCPRCQMKFKSKYVLRTHIRNAHENMKAKKKKVTTSSSSSLNQCQYCPRSFLCKYNLERHEKMHNNLRELKCPECPYAANYPGNLRNHMKVHKEKTFTCQYCPKTFRMKVSLENHENTHTQRKPFICPVEGCGIGFNSSGSRSLHEWKKHGIPRKRHLNHEEKQNKEEKRFLCDLCPKKYKDNRDLRRHREGAHGNPEMVKCPHCPKMFRNFRLHYHFKAVHEEKLLRCQHCPKTFTGEDGLKSHEETHVILK